MLGLSVLTKASSSTTDNRMFVYEVEGLRQNNQTEQRSYPIRNSSTTFIQVPFNRMNDMMQNITRLGGKIVAIRPLAGTPEAQQTVE